MDRDFIQSVVFCEDLRTERNGKEIAIGLYNGAILVLQVPIVLPSLIFRFELHFHGTPVQQMILKMTDPNENKLFEQVVPISFADWNSPGTVAAGVQGMIFPTVGEYVLSVRFFDDWVVARKLYIHKIEAAPG